ncbi:carbohydrate ABC transporter permease [Candidatus Ozemobacteraceae bacterium]|nr:carbohydrate ABC transporter permease [Candidatus Ozemobacteraceae bacterium]
MTGVDAARAAGAGTATSRPRSRTAGPLLTLFLGALLLSYLYPLIYMLARSVMRFEPGMAASGVGFTLDQYRTVLGNGGFLWYVWNSVFVLAAVVGANVVSSLLAGYAFARYRFPGRSLLFGVVLVTLMVPKQALMVPILDLVFRIGLHDTLWALILPFCVDSFNVFLLRQYISALPADLEDAARADGAGELAILRHVVFPLCRPAIAVVVINTAIVTWNSFLFPLILTDSAARRTLPVGLAMLTQGPYSTDWGTLMAGSAVSSIPLILLFLAFQRHIIEGITAGALRE